MRLPIGQLHPSVRPDQVIHEAGKALATLHPVEKKDLEVVGQIPRVVLRFAVQPASRPQEDVAARLALARVRQHLALACCEIRPDSKVVLERREGGQFRSIPAGLEGH